LKKHLQKQYHNNGGNGGINGKNPFKTECKISNYLDTMSSPGTEE
jgi:hypothetical protein